MLIFIMDFIVLIKNTFLRAEFCTFPQKNSHQFNTKNIYIIFKLCMEVLNSENLVYCYIKSYRRIIKKLYNALIRCNLIQIIEGDLKRK